MFKILLDIAAPVTGFTVTILAFFDRFNPIVAAIIGVMSIIYLGYKIRNERRRNEN